jgi:hypothetical protein
MCFDSFQKMHFVNSQENLIDIRASVFGLGVFAAQKIAPGIPVCSITGKQISFKETLLLGERESHAIQIGIDKYILCEPPFLFSNHSCQPNCGINSHLELFTLREIEQGEELFWDYSTSMLEQHWTMDCACANSNCRKIITDFDLLPSQLQQQYIKMNIVLPYILNHMDFRIAI